MPRRNRARRHFRLPSLLQTELGLLAVVAILIQSLVVQTHFHRPPVHSPQLAGEIGANASHDPIKRDDDSSNCALCQAFTHAGQFLHSAAVLARAPVWFSAHVIDFKDPLSVRFALSHSWQGRAPPLI
jgi:hypothetical protein